MNGFSPPVLTHTRGIIQSLHHLLPKHLSKAQTPPFPAGVAPHLQNPDFGSSLLSCSSDLVSWRQDLTLCGDVRILGSKDMKGFLPRRKACGQSGWVSSGCVGCCRFGWVSRCGDGPGRASSTPRICSETGAGQVSWPWRSRRKHSQGFCTSGSEQTRSMLWGQMRRKGMSGRPLPLKVKP